MPIVNLTNPLITILCLSAIVCLIYLGYEVKRAVSPMIALILSVGLLIMHAIQLFAFDDNTLAQMIILSGSMIYDFGLVLVSFLGYLWIDNIEAKYRNKKSIDDSLEWFWKKV